MSAHMDEKALRPAAWLAARTVLVQCPDHPVNPGGVLYPEYGFEEAMFARFDSLKGVEGPLVNGIVAFTWEDDPASSDDLIARSADLVHEAIQRRLLPGSAADQ